MDPSLGVRLWVFPDFVRLSMLPIRESNFGLCCDVAVDGDEGVPLVEPLAFACEGGGLTSG